jgi:hypothetical protein
MQESYGVVWREGTGPLGRGKLELHPRSLHLDGLAGPSPAVREIAYDDLALVRVGRAPAERITGRPSLVLELRSGEPLAIGSVSQPGVIGELAERIATLQAGRRTAVVLPIRPGAHEAVRALLVDGPPFDPDAIGLDRHQVFLTPDEVVFMFESRLGGSVLDPLLAAPGVWERASAWHEHLAGPPRIAEAVYAWSRPDIDVDQPLLPPGLRNGNDA